jgi:hypothetical protein
VKEGELAPAVTAHLTGLGYRVFVNPDGTDYFDVVARRGSEIGLIELKVADYRKVFAQALRRRGFGDWVAVVLPTERRVRRCLDRPAPPLGEKVGLWFVNEGKLEVVRGALPLYEDGREGPFPEQRRQLEELLDHLEGGRIPPGTTWGFVRHSPGGRSTRDFRLEEFEKVASGPDDAADPG